MPVSAADTRLKLSLSYHVPLCVSRMMVFFFPRMILLGFCYRVLDLSLGGNIIGIIALVSNGEG